MLMIEKMEKQKMNKLKIGNQYRGLNIESGMIDKENRTVDLSFSSEEPVERWFGMEILDHKSSSVDLSRLNNGAAVLIDHYGDQVGVVEQAEIKEDKRGYAKLRFGNSQRAKDVFQDIVDGIRKNVSFGYQVLKMVEDKTDKAKKTIYRATKWMPFEVSIVGVPADATIGIGRSAKEITFETEIEETTPKQKQRKTIVIV